jgi:hypothetical protein
MIATTFPQVNIEIAKNQPEYNTLPAFYNPEDGTTTFCFELELEEIQQIARTGKIWIQQLTFGQKMQPISGSCLKPENLE